MEKIKILFVFHGKMSKGGTEQVMTTIYDNIDRRRFSIDFLIISNVEDDSEEKKHFINSGAKFFYISGKKKHFFKHFKELNKFFETEHYDIVHSHINAVGNGVLSVAKKHGVRVRVAHSHNTWHMLEVKNLKDIGHFVYLELERFLIRKNANYFLGCSNAAGEWLFGRKIVVTDRYMNYYNSVVYENFAFDDVIRGEVRTELGLEQHKTIGHVGRFDYQKNHELLIRIFKYIYEKDDDWRLVLVGNGNEYEHIRKSVYNYGIKDRVLFLGERNDVPRLLQGFDAFVFPSRYEGLGISIVEAQISGLSCFVSPGVPHEAIISEKTIVVSEYDNPKVWGDIIINKMRRDDRYVSDDILKRKGFDIETNITRLETIYNIT